jgi:hypothetical protein
MSWPTLSSEGSTTFSWKPMGEHKGQLPALRLPVNVA